MYFLIFVVGALRIAQANMTKQASCHTRSIEALLQYGMYFEFATALISFLFLCFNGFHGFYGFLLLCSVFTAVCFFSELLISMSAMKTAPLVLCNISAMGGFIILPSVVSIFLFDEPMSLPKWLGVGVFFAAAYLLSPPKEGEQPPLTIKTLLLLASCFIVNGLCGIISKYYALYAETVNEAMYTCVTYLCTSGVYAAAFLLRTRNAAQRPAMPKKLYTLGATMGVICCLLMYLNTLLAKTVPVVILNSVPSAISIIGCLFTGYLLYKEKITWKNAIGLLCGILSICLIV